MADYYVSATATGGGDGSSGNPWTWDEMAAVATANATFVADDVIRLSPGTHNASVQCSLYPNYMVVRSEDSGDKAVVTGKFNYLMRTHGSSQTWRDLDFRDVTLRPQSGGTCFYRCEFDTDCSQTFDSAEYKECRFTGATWVRANVRDSLWNGNAESVQFQSSSLSMEIEDSVFTNGAHSTAGFNGSNKGHRLKGVVAVGNVGADVYMSGGTCDFADCIIGTYTNTGGVALSNFQNSFFINDPGDSDHINDKVVLGFDPFEDAAGLDFRLNATALASPHAQAMKDIVRRLKNVPGITIDEPGGGGVTINGSFGFGGLE